MSITPGYIFIFKAGLRKEKSIYCGISFNWFTGFCEPAFLMNEGDPENREHWGSNHHNDSWNIIYGSQPHPIL
jgi:hypothetical protein